MIGIEITTGLSPVEVEAGEVDHYNDILLQESEGGPAIRRALITGSRERCVAAAEVYVRRLDLWAKVAIPPHIPSELLQIRDLRVVRVGGFTVRGRVTIDDRGPRVEVDGAVVPIVSVNVKLEQHALVEADLVIEDPSLVPEAWPEDLIRRLLTSAGWELAEGEQQLAGGA